MPPTRSVVYSPRVPIDFNLYKALRQPDAQEVSELHVVAPIQGQFPAGEFKFQFGSFLNQRFLNQIIANFPDGSRIEVSGRMSTNGVFEAKEVPPEQATTYLFSVFYPGDAPPMYFLIEPHEEDLLRNRGVAEKVLNEMVQKFYERGNSLPNAFKWFCFESGWPDRKNNGKPVFQRVIDA